MHKLYATGTTGSLLEKDNRSIHHKVPEWSIGWGTSKWARASPREKLMCSFSGNPMESQPHDPDIKALLRVAATWNIPVACNRATADFLLTSPLMHHEYEAILTDYSSYTNRKLKN